jgi:HSP20 family protein
MAFFPRALVGSHPDSSLSPFFGLLNELDAFRNNDRHHAAHLKSFQPRFDVKELEASYELHGEFPGVSQKDIDIEFSDPQTITIRGHSEREYTSGTLPRAIKEFNVGGATIEGQTYDSHASHQATVEEANEPGENSEVAETNEETSDRQAPQTKYWLSERSVGEFARSFSFPSRIDQDGVKASLTNGILNVVVPKAKKHESRKISIN